MAARSYVLSMSDVSVSVTGKANQVKNSLLSIGSSAPAVREKSQAVAKAVKEPFSTLGSSAYSIMSNVGSSLNRGLADKKATIIATAKNIANSVSKTIKTVLKIASPSKVMRQIGEQTAQGLAIGIGAGVHDVGNSADTLARTISDRTYSADIHTGGQSDMSGIASRLDMLISLMQSGQQVMNVDGRVFARLIKEYS